MKFTMIIADDEQLVLKNEELLVKKEFPNIEILGLAENGIEFKNMVEQYDPDIAIADINMPGITGLEAIELLHGKGCRTRFLVNTAYSEFEYVKKAIDEKVDGYILKPGKRNEIIDSISKICKSIEFEKANEEENQNIKSILKMMTPTYENELLLSILADKPMEEEFKSYCQVKNINAHKGCIVTFMKELKETEVDIRLLNQTIDNILNDVCLFLSACNEEYLIVLLMVPEQIEEYRAKTWCGEIAQLIADELGKATTTKFKYGLGNIYDEFSKFKLSYQESLGEFLRDDEEEIKDVDFIEKAKKYVNEAKKFISNNYKEDISLVDCAENVGISPYYLSHLFKDETGQTFVEYLSKIRIKEAKKLCEDSSLSIKDIAALSGYSNITYFYKVFKKETGQTIGDYRKKENKNV